jgi:hypothetical protein
MFQLSTITSLIVIALLLHSSGAAGVQEKVAPPNQLLIQGAEATPSRKLAGQQNDQYLVALTQAALGDLYQNRSDFVEAEQAYMKAVVIVRQQPDHALALAVLLRNGYCPLGSTPLLGSVSFL